MIRREVTEYNYSHYTKLEHILKHACLGRITAPEHAGILDSIIMYILKLVLIPGKASGPTLVLALGLVSVLWCCTWAPPGTPKTNLMNMKSGARHLVLPGLNFLVSLNMT